MFRNSFLVISFCLFTSICGAQIHFHYLDVRGQPVISLDSVDSNSRYQQYFIDLDDKPYTGKVYGYFSSTLISQFCVRDGVWDGFRESFVYGKHYPDSIAVIEYHEPANRITFKQRRKNKINGRQLSFIRIYGQKLDVEYRIHQRSGMFFLRIIEYFNNNKQFSKRLRFSDLSELKDYLYERHDFIKSYTDFFEHVHFFSEYYTPYKTGCLYN